jgi:hypothetical protein
MKTDKYVTWMRSEIFTGVEIKTGFLIYVTV